MVSPVLKVCPIGISQAPPIFASPTPARSVNRKLPAPDTLMLQVCGACLSDSEISPSKEPPTAATLSCMSTL